SWKGREGRRGPSMFPGVRLPSQGPEDVRRIGNRERHSHRPPDEADAQSVLAGGGVLRRDVVGRVHGGGQQERKQAGRRREERARQECARAEEREKVAPSQRQRCAETEQGEERQRPRPGPRREPAIDLRPYRRRRRDDQESSRGYHRPENARRPQRALAHRAVVAPGDEERAVRAESAERERADEE